ISTHSAHGRGRCPPLGHRARQVTCAAEVEDRGSASGARRPGSHLRAQVTVSPVSPGSTSLFPSESVQATFASQTVFIALDRTMPPATRFPTSTLLLPVMSILPPTVQSATTVLLPWMTMSPSTAHRTRTASLPLTCTSPFTVTPRSAKLLPEATTSPP